LPRNPSRLNFCLILTPNTLAKTPKGSYIDLSMREWVEWSQARFPLVYIKP